MSRGGRPEKKSTKKPKPKSSDQHLDDLRQEIEASLSWLGNPRTKTAGTNTTYLPRRSKPKKPEVAKKSTKPKCLAGTGDATTMSKDGDHSPKYTSAEEMRKRLNLVLDLDLQSLGSAPPEIEDKALLEAFKHLLQNKEVKEAVDHWIKLQLPSDVSDLSASEKSEKEFSDSEQVNEIEGPEKKISNTAKNEDCRQSKIRSKTPDLEVPRCKGFMSLSSREKENESARSRITGTPRRKVRTPAKKIQTPMKNLPLSASDTSQHADVSHGGNVDESSTAISTESTLLLLGSKDKAVVRRCLPRVLNRVGSRRHVNGRTLLLPPRRSPWEFMSKMPVTTSDTDGTSSQPCAPFPAILGSLSKTKVPRPAPTTCDACVLTSPPAQSLSRPQVTSKSALRPRIRKHINRHHHDIKTSRSARSRHSSSSDTMESRDSSVVKLKESEKWPKKLLIQMPDVSDETAEQATSAVEVDSDVLHESTDNLTCSSPPADDSSVLPFLTRTLHKLPKARSRVLSAKTQTSHRNHKTNATQTRHHQRNGSDKNLESLAAACRMLIEELSKKDKPPETPVSIPKHEIALQTDQQAKVDAEVNTSRELRHSKSSRSRKNKESHERRRRKQDTSAKCSQIIQTEGEESSCVIPFLRSTNNGEAALSLFKLSQGVLVPFSDDYVSIPCSPEVEKMAPPGDDYAEPKRSCIENGESAKEEEKEIMVQEMDSLPKEPVECHYQVTLEQDEEAPLGQELCDKLVEQKEANLNTGEENEEKQYPEEVCETDDVMIMDMDDSNEWRIEDIPDEFTVESDDLNTFTCLKGITSDEHFEKYVVYSNVSTKFPVAQVCLPKMGSSATSTYSDGKSKSWRESKVSRATSVSRIESSEQDSSGGGSAFGPSQKETNGEVMSSRDGPEPMYCNVKTYYENSAPDTYDGSAYILGNYSNTYGYIMEENCNVGNSGGGTTCSNVGANVGNSGYGGNCAGIGSNASCSLPNVNPPNYSQQVPFPGGGGFSGVYSEEMELTPCPGNPNGGDFTSYGTGGENQSSGDGGGGGGGGGNGGERNMPICAPNYMQEQQSNGRDFAGEMPPCQIPSSLPSPRPALKLVNDLGPMQGPCGRAPFAPPPAVPCSGPPTNVGTCFGPCPKHGERMVVPTLISCENVPLVQQEAPCGCNNWNWNYNQGPTCPCGHGRSMFYQNNMNNANNNNFHHNNNNNNHFHNNNNASNNNNNMFMPNMYCSRVPAEKESESGRPPPNFFREYCDDM